jgi:hypothetical protein
MRQQPPPKEDPQLSQCPDFTCPECSRSLWLHAVDDHVGAKPAGWTRAEWLAYFEEEEKLMAHLLKRVA